MVWRRDPARNPGGALFDDGVHKYATAACWIGEIGEVSAIVTRGADFILETPSVATWRFKGRDCLGIIDYTYAPEMTIRAPLLPGRRVLRDPRQPRHHLGDPLHRRDARHAAGDGDPRHRDRQLPGADDWRLGFDGAAADFVDGVLDGRQPAQDVQAARHMLQVPLAIYESGRTGHIVRPDSIT